MMTLQWLSVAAFLYTEVGLGLLFCLGFISNARWRMIFTSRLLALIKDYGTFLFSAFVLMLFVLFGDSVWNTIRFSSVDSSKIDLRNNPQAEIQAHMKLFRAQRNLYITGFSLFLLIVLRRLVMLISRQAQVEATNEALLNQAKGASEQARKLMVENEELQKGNRGKATASTREAEEEKKLLLDMIETLKEDLKETTDKLETSEADLAAMKAQSEGLHREYDRILDEHNKLEKKVAMLSYDPSDERSSDDKKDN